MKATESDLAMWMTMGNIKTEIDTSTTAGKIAVMQAFADGKKIEGCYKIGGSEWHIHTKSDWNWLEYDYRIVPETKTRPLRASDWDGFPVVWVRGKKTPTYHWLVTDIDPEQFCMSRVPCSWDLSETEQYEWSTDRKTWKPFTVEATE